jgi:hypothetical protein
LDIEEPEDQWVHGEEEESQNQWVHDEEDEEGYPVDEEHILGSGEALERFESMSTLDKPRANEATSDQLDTEFPEETGACVVSYYPMIGVFSTQEEMHTAFKRTHRPGEKVKIESQSSTTLTEQWELYKEGTEGMLHAPSPLQ